MKTYNKPSIIVFKLKFEICDDIGFGGGSTWDAPKAHRLTDDSNADDLDEFIP